MSDCKVTITGIVRDKTHHKFIVDVLDFGHEAYPEVSYDEWHINGNFGVQVGQRVTITGDFDWGHAAGYDNDPPEFYIRNPEITILPEEQS